VNYELEAASFSIGLQNEEIPQTFSISALNAHLLIPEKRKMSGATQTHEKMRTEVQIETQEDTSSVSNRFKATNLEKKQNILFNGQINKLNEQQEPSDSHSYYQHPYYNQIDEVLQDDDGTFDIDQQALQGKALSPQLLGEEISYFKKSVGSKNLGSTNHHQTYFSSQKPGSLENEEFSSAMLYPKVSN